MSAFTSNSIKTNGKKRKRTSDAEIQFKTPPQNAQVSKTGEVSESDNNYASDHEGFSDGDASEMEDLIEDNNLNSLLNKPSESNVHKDLNSKCDDLFTENYLVDPPITHLVLISDTLASAITQWCRLPAKKEEIKEMFKQSLIPKNIEGLYPVHINELLFQKLPFKARLNDQRLRGTNTFLAQGAGPVASIFQDLCRIEILLKSDCNSFKILGEKISGDGIEIDFTDLRSKLGNALCLLTLAHALQLSSRKQALKPFLDFKSHHLLKDTNPVTENLLGPDLEQKITDPSKISDVARKLSVQRQFSSPCGRSLQTGRGWTCHRLQGRCPKFQSQFQTPPHMMKAVDLINTTLPSTGVDFKTTGISDNLGILSSVLAPGTPPEGRDV